VAVSFSGTDMRILDQIITAFSLAVLVFTFPAETRTAGREAGASGVRLNIMSFNIRTLMITDGRDFWSFRKDHVAELIKDHRPDVMGLQEVFTIQAKDLERRLDGYKWFGPGRRDGNSRGERCPIYYQASRVELLEQGTFWLSEEPESPGSMSWDSMFPRLVTWGKFRHRDSGREFFVFNTHFDHAGVIARRRSAELVLEKMKEISGECPAVLLGDLNAAEDSEVYASLASSLKDARKASQKEPQGPCNTFWTFDLDSDPRARLDYIFVTEGVAVKSHQTIADTYGKGRRPSDHMPVTVTVELE